MKHTHEQLRDAFEKVQNTDDWRAEIDGYVRLEERDITVEAIGCFAGCSAQTALMANGWVRVQAVGYRNGPAGP